MGKKIDKAEREREVTIDDEVQMFLRSQGLSSSDELLELGSGELDAAVTASGLTLGARRQLRRELGLDPGGRNGAPRGRAALLAGSLATPKKSSRDACEEEDEPLPASQKIRSRLGMLAANPLQKFLASVDAMKEHASPLDGTPFGEKVAPEYLARVFQSGQRAAVYAAEWRRVHHLEDCRHSEPMLLCAATIDQLLMSDNIEVLNSVGVELLARRMYSLERTYEKCLRPGEWKSKAQLNMMTHYDVIAGDATGPRVTAADASARKLMEQDALAAKWASKTASGTAAGGE